MKKQTTKQLFWEIFRFLLVGATATLADYLVFWVFDAWIFPKRWGTVALVLATALGFCVGLLVNWILSVRFVFRETKEEIDVRSKKPFAVFAIIGLIGLAITELGVVLLVFAFPEITLFGKTALFGTAWEKWFAKAIMTCLVLVWNYLGRKIFIFRS
ncbi:MAG: GtrA family protein [Clostridia bacterium]|nr:GtrA family protein [Clostridia bacterium]